MTTVPGNVRITRHIGDIDDNGHHTTVNLNEPVEVVTASGAATTIDYETAHWWDVTLTANCTITIDNPPASSIAGELIVVLRQGGSGSYTVTWPGSVDWQDTDGTGGGAAPTLWTVVGALNVITLVTFDGGTTWGGSTGGSAVSYATPAIVLGTAAAAGAASTVIRSDATIVAFDATVPVTQAFGDAAATGSAAKAARRDHVHGMPATPSGGGGGHMHVVSENHLSNGSGTTYTLDQAFEVGSVIAWNTTTLARLGVTEAQPDQATVSAAGSSGDTIMFDYAATVV